MIHAYELDLLTDRERDMFEQHLLTCDYCFEQVRAFQPAVALIRQSSLADTQPGQANVTAAISDADRTGAETHKQRAGRSRWIWPVLTAAAVLLFLIFKPWQIRIQPTDEAVAQPNLLVIFNFGVLGIDGADSQIGRMTTSLLITDLGESDHFSIVSSQRLYDLQTLLGLEDSAVASDEIASEVARRARARWMITGQVIQSESDTAITSHVIDVNTGAIVSSEKVRLQSGESFFGLVDRLSSRFRANLTPSELIGSDSDRDVASMTTHSLAAYRDYHEGVENFRKFFYIEARESLQKAIARDSTFAMAYYYLSRVSDPDSSAEYLRRAVRYIDHAGTRDRYYILARHNLALRQTDKAIHTLLEATKRFPDEVEAHLGLAALFLGRRDYDRFMTHSQLAFQAAPWSKEAANYIGYAYSIQGNLDSALAFIDRYIDLAPGEPNPYDSRGEILLSRGKIDDAIEAFSQALNIAPRYYPALRNLGAAYVFAQRYEAADSCFDAMLLPDSLGRKPAHHPLRALVAMYRGKFSDAEAILDSSLPMARDPYAMNRLTEMRESRLRATRIALEIERGKKAAAIEAYDRLLEEYSGNMYDKREVLIHYIPLLADSGLLVRATELLETNHRVLVDQSNDSSFYFYCRGSIQLNSGEPCEAIDDFLNVQHFRLALRAPMMRAVALIAGGEAREAADIFRSLHSGYFFTQLIDATWRAKLPYYMGRTFYGMGQEEEALVYLQEFLELWKDADSDITALSDARHLVALIESGQRGKE